MYCRTDDRKAFRTFNIVDEYSRECLAILVYRKLNSGNVLSVMNDLFTMRGLSYFIRSDNGLEFVAEAVRDWIKVVAAKRLISIKHHVCSRRLDHEPKHMLQGPRRKHRQMPKLAP